MGLGGAGGCGDSHRAARFPNRRKCAPIQRGQSSPARSRGVSPRVSYPTIGGAASARHATLARRVNLPGRSGIDERPERGAAMSKMPVYRLSHLDALEAESIFIIREVVAELERPVLLFSGGKDSIVMLRLAEKAFAPARIPFPVMHVDTGHNFPEVLEFRDRRVAELGLQLVVASVPEALEAGLVQEPPDGMR